MYFFKLCRVKNYRTLLLADKYIYWYFCMLYGFVVVGLWGCIGGFFWIVFSQYIIYEIIYSYLMIYKYDILVDWNSCAFFTNKLQFFSSSNILLVFCTINSTHTLGWNQMWTQFPPLTRLNPKMWKSIQIANNTPTNPTQTIKILTLIPIYIFIELNRPLEYTSSFSSHIIGYTPTQITET